MRKRIPKAQIEFQFAPAVFNLAVQAGNDGERQAAALHKSTEDKTFATKQQTTMTNENQLEN